MSWGVVFGRGNGAAKRFNGEVDEMDPVDDMDTVELDREMLG